MFKTNVSNPFFLHCVIWLIVWNFPLSFRHFFSIFASHYHEILNSRKKKFRVMIGCDSLGESGAAPPPPTFLSIEEKKKTVAVVWRVTETPPWINHRLAVDTRREQVPPSFDSPISSLFFLFFFFHSRIQTSEKKRKEGRKEETFLTI